MPKVKVRKNESFDHALKRFMREVNRSGVLRERRLRNEYKKESEIKREKREAKQRKIRMDQRRRRR